MRTKTGKDDEMPSTSRATSVSSSDLSFPKLLPSKLFFCRNRFCVGATSDEHVDLVDEILDSISAIERRFKSICGCDDSDIDRTIRIIGAEECALLLTTIIACKERGSIEMDCGAVGAAVVEATPRMTPQ